MANLITEPVLAGNPYLRGRFLLDGIVKKLAQFREQLDFKPRIYAEKNGRLNPPFIFVRVADTSLRPLNYYYYQETYMVQVQSRVKESLTAYRELEDIKCILFDALEWIELPLANPRAEGSQPVGKNYPVRGYGLRHIVSNMDDYAELDTLVRYKLQLFRENPVIAKMRTQKVKEKIIYKK